jgi:hypothetical protein
MYYTPGTKKYVKDNVLHNWIKNVKGNVLHTWNKKNVKGKIMYYTTG